MKAPLVVLLFVLLSHVVAGCRGKEQKSASTTSDSTYTVGFLMETYDLESMEKRQDILRRQMPITRNDRAARRCGW